MLVTLGTTMSVMCISAQRGMTCTCEGRLSHHSSIAALYGNQKHFVIDNQPIMSDSELTASVLYNVLVKCRVLTHIYAQHLYI
ncbi:hypothetical protein F5B22DRAFT_432724 [Xylaria bambusicola]|uniref:uncharacterized protein n=1 Tax=Xylaria bambusicola TaxID=326684 RepID=UPI0020089E71|nr:uncharacterized protein F5B22DRAFT_432724 [Xylaria bambusicola]KAI0506844.1 hypothetical protein F5B22DRAFT_432724 [Xylaria bambusicola]